MILSTLVSTMILAGGVDDSCAANRAAAADHPGRNIVETAVAAGSFETLAAALGAADLVSALQGDGPFTVFAPTDEAFARLPQEQLAFLLEPENKPLLQAILTYLGCDPHTYDARLDRPNFGQRLNYYPPVTGDDAASGAGRLLGHEDIDLFTLLPAPSVEGLQVLHRTTAALLVPAFGLAALLARREPGIGRLAWTSMNLTILQIGVGALNVLTRLPVEVTGLHSALACAIALLSALMVRGALRARVAQPAAHALPTAEAA